MELLKDIESKLSTDDEEKAFEYFDLDGNGLPSGQLLSPPFADSIPMDGEFSAAAPLLIDAFVRNVLYRQIRLTNGAWRRIIDFITTSDFETDSSSRVCLQIIFLYSKADPVELDRLRKRNDAYSIAFEEEVSRFLETFYVETMNAEKMVKTKSILSLPGVRNALKSCLIEVLGEENYDEAKVANAIESMVIYEGNMVAVPLRGASLRDGIFINSVKLSPFDPIRTRNNDNHEADMITITSHESVHFLARKLTNNYNFSSPFSGRFGNNGAAGGARPDPIIPNKNLESGRLIELKLFGFQPNWLRSDRSAASKFIGLVADPVASLSLPFTSIGPGLKARDAPSLSFGIDPEIDQGESMFE